MVVCDFDNRMDIGFSGDAPDRKRRENSQTVIFSRSLIIQIRSRAVAGTRIKSVF